MVQQARQQHGPRRSLCRQVAGLGLFLAACMGYPLSATATELRFATPGAPKDLSDRFRKASHLAANAHSAEAQTQLAAALSDYRTLIQVAYDAGYFAPEISIKLDGHEAATIDLLTQPKAIYQIDITVAPGRKFTFGTARLSPMPRPSPENSPEFPEDFAPGRPATTGTLQAAVAAGIKAWGQAGHPKAALGRQDISANARTAVLDARLTLAPGPRLRLGALRLDAQRSHVRPSAVQRIAGFETGAIYHPDLVRQAASRLRRTGAFSSVTVKQLETPNSDGSLDFVAALADQPKRRVTAGVEFSSTEAASFSLGWMHRNLFGQAERLKLDLSLDGIGDSDLNTTFSLRLDQPAAFGPDESLFYVAKLQDLNEDHYRAKQGYGAIGLRRTINSYSLFEATIGLNKIDADDAFGTGREFTYLTGRLRGERDLRDVKTNPTSGYYLNGALTPFIGLKGGRNGVQMRLDGRSYHSLDHGKRLILAGRVQGGTVIGPELERVSPSLLFFSGGAGTVRGQQFQSLGIPVGSDVAGGRSFLAASAELRGRVRERLWLVGFYDVGLVGRKTFPSTNSKSHAGYGIGVRYDVAGIGPLRLDLAVPSGDGLRDLQVYIGIGQAF